MWTAGPKCLAKIRPLPLVGLPGNGRDEANHPDRHRGEVVGVKLEERTRISARDRRLRVKDGRRWEERGEGEVWEEKREGQRMTTLKKSR